MAHPEAGDRTILPLLVTSMAVVAPLLFILGIVIGNHLQGNETLSSDSISSWLSAIATVAIAILTFILAKETWYLREAQIRQLQELRRENIRPNVGISLENSPAGIHFFNVKVSNFGKGIARKIHFSFFDRDGHKVSTTGEDIVVDEFLKLTMFTAGIRSMGINQVLSSFVFSFLDLTDQVGGDVFKAYLNIVVDFEDVEGSKYSNCFEIDFSQYGGFSNVGGADATYTIADEIKKLRQHLVR